MTEQAHNVTSLPNDQNDAFQLALTQEQQEMDAAQTEHLKKRLPQLRYQLNDALDQIKTLQAQNQELQAQIKNLTQENQKGAIDDDLPGA